MNYFQYNPTTALLNNEHTGQSLGKLKWRRPEKVPPVPSCTRYHLHKSPLLYRQVISDNFKSVFPMLKLHSEWSSA